MIPWKNFSGRFKYLDSLGKFVVVVALADGFSFPEVSRTFHESTRKLWLKVYSDKEKGESSSAEQHALHKDCSSSCQQTCIVVHMQSTWWVSPGWSSCTCISSVKSFRDYAVCHNSTVNGTRGYHLMGCENRTFTLFVTIKCQHEAFVWCNVSWHWSGKTVIDD